MFWQFALRYQLYSNLFTIWIYIVSSWNYACFQSVFVIALPADGNYNNNSPHPVTTQPQGGNVIALGYWPEVFIVLSIQPTIQDNHIPLEPWKMEQTMAFDRCSMGDHNKLSFLSSPESFEY